MSLKRLGAVQAKGCAFAKRSTFALARLRRRRGLTASTPATSYRFH